MWIWDYNLTENWHPKKAAEWEWFLVRKINFGDFKDIKGKMLKKYFLKIKKWLDPGKREMIENFLQRWN